jgi:hypothetical protein
VPQRDIAEKTRLLVESRIELLEAQRALEVARASRQQKLAIREAEMERNRALEEAGAEPGELSPEPPEVAQEIFERVKIAEKRLEELEKAERADVEDDFRSGEPSQIRDSETSSSKLVHHAALAVAVQKVAVVILAFLVLNLPILCYGLIYDRFPHLLTSIVYLGSFLAMAGAAGAICRKCLVREVAQSTQLVFGLQVMFCFLPGLFLGCSLASPYLKATFLEPVAEFRSGAGYYAFEKVVIRGDLQASESRTRHTKTGESTSKVTTTYNVAPLMSADDKLGPFWVVREGGENRFPGKAQTVSPFQGLTTLSSSTLRAAAEKSMERSEVRITDDFVFLVELKPQDLDWYARYFGLSLGLLNLLVLAGTSFALFRTPATSSKK